MTEDTFWKKIEIYCLFFKKQHSDANIIIHEEKETGTFLKHLFCSIYFILGYQEV